MPFCPKCRSEYEDFVTVCADCGAALTADPPEDVENEPQPSFEDLTWPEDTDGQPVKAAHLQFVPNHQQIQMTRTFLAAFGIPTLPIEPNRSTFTTVLFGTELHGVDLYVPETRLQEAQDILAAPYVEEDGDSQPDPEPNSDWV